MQKLMSHSLRVMLFILVISLMSSCVANDNNNAENLPNNSQSYKTPKYIFFFIGDGMGLPQISLAQVVLNHNQKNLLPYGMSKLNITDFPVTGMATTYAENRYITGSAAAGTALATGHKTTINTISKNGNHSSNLKTIAEMAKDKGMKVGIVSSVSIDHATPACFYAHESSRKNYFKIAAQMLNSKVDYFGGGYALGDTLHDLQNNMKKAGYKIVSTREELQSLKNKEKVWAYNHTYDSYAALWYEIDRPEDHISLSEFTQKGIDLLDNEEGFFMMVEGGKIDWACHANDAVAAAYDVIEFDKSVAKAIEFYNRYPDETLIVVTADHETGGLSLGYALTKYESAFEILKYQTVSFEKLTEIVDEYLKTERTAFTFEIALKLLAKYTGLGNSSLDETLTLSEYDMQLLNSAYHELMKGKSDKLPEQLQIDRGGYNALLITANHILNRKAGIDWATYSHTAVPVPVFAIGQGQYEFTGYYDNTDIAKKIIKIGALQSK